MEKFIIQEFKIFVLVLAVFLVIDLPMILYINKDMYLDTLKKINKKKNPKGLRVYISAFITYMLLAFGVYYFSVKQNSSFNGVILGLVIYGVYNYTNYATIRKYPLEQTLIDTAWGTVLCGIVGYLSIIINNNFLKVSITGTSIGSIGNTEINTETTISS
jgi:uncharacterized membrane protein